MLTNVSGKGRRVFGERMRTSIRYAYVRLVQHESDKCKLLGDPTRLNACVLLYSPTTTIVGVVNVRGLLGVTHCACQYDTVMATGSNRFSPSPFVKAGHLIIFIARLVTALLVATWSRVMCSSCYACIWFSRLPD